MHGDVGGTRNLREPHGLIEKRFSGSNLDQHRRQAREIGVDRRDERTPRIGAVQVEARQLGEVGPAEQGIDRGLGFKACAGEGEIDPGRTQPETARQRQACFAQRQDRRESETATRALPASAIRAGAMPEARRKR